MKIIKLTQSFLLVLADKRVRNIYAEKCTSD